MIRTTHLNVGIRFCPKEVFWFTPTNCQILTNNLFFWPAAVSAWVRGENFNEESEDTLKNIAKSSFIVRDENHCLWVIKVNFTYKTKLVSIYEIHI